MFHKGDSRRHGATSVTRLAATLGKIQSARHVSPAKAGTPNPASIANRALRALQPALFRFTADQLDVIGHQLAERGEMPSAVKVLAFNAAAQLVKETAERRFG